MWKEQVNTHGRFSRHFTQTLLVLTLGVTAACAAGGQGLDAQSSEVDAVGATAAPLKVDASESAQDEIDIAPDGVGAGYDYPFDAGEAVAQLMDVDSAACRVTLQWCADPNRGKRPSCTSTGCTVTRARSACESLIKDTCGFKATRYYLDGKLYPPPPPPPSGCLVGGSVVPCAAPVTE
jgi:hypothetical protein